MKKMVYVREFWLIKIAAVFFKNVWLIKLMTMLCLLKMPQMIILLPSLFNDTSKKSTNC